MIKPQSGFKIAFAMLDQDGNERIDKEEFKAKTSRFDATLADWRAPNVYCNNCRILDKAIII